MPATLLTLLISATAQAGTEPFERYTFQGTLQNEGNTGGSITGCGNLRYVDLGAGRQAAENTFTNPDEIFAIPEMGKSLLEPKTAGIRASVWIKTRDRQGVIRSVQGWLVFTTSVCLGIQESRHAKVYLPLAAPKATRAVNTNLRNQLKKRQLPQLRKNLGIRI
ncbi:MAG: hypothetical protein WAX69_08850 [Victivallales bacterium]